MTSKDQESIPVVIDSRFIDERTDDCGQRRQSSSKRRVSTSDRRPTREPDLPLAFELDPTRDGSTDLPEEPPLDNNVSTWNVSIPVFEWEIDPTDTERRCGSADVRYLGWDFRMWWEKHPTGLIYASLQATKGSRERDWQGGWAFPADRISSVKLVYDEQRHGIASINGSARDLRPFIEAFLMGYGIGPSF